MKIKSIKFLSALFALVIVVGLFAAMPLSASALEFIPKDDIIVLPKLIPVMPVRPPLPLPEPCPLDKIITAIQVKG